ncbi:hypothetical protein CMI47_03760 [Candidatus Pacearchaeota archaeon]|jgi:hypothetical protein|nr:hypothetical protein [Candidatus Pacearchaeota archaeon]
MPDLLIRSEAGREKALRMLSCMTLDGKAWAFSLKRKPRKRSLQQNALYHKWAGIIAADLGNSHDEMTTILRQKFLAPKVIEIYGEVYEVWPSTTTLSVAEMSDYMDKIQAWAATDLGVHLHIPEEQHLEAR